MESTEVGLPDGADPRQVTRCPRIPTRLISRRCSRNSATRASSSSRRGCRGGASRRPRHDPGPRHRPPADAGERGTSPQGAAADRRDDAVRLRPSRVASDRGDAGRAGTDQHLDDPRTADGASPIDAIPVVRDGCASGVAEVEQRLRPVQPVVRLVVERLVLRSATASRSACPGRTAASAPSASPRDTTSRAADRRCRARPPRTASAAAGRRGRRTRRSRDRSARGRGSSSCMPTRSMNARNCSRPNVNRGLRRCMLDGTRDRSATGSLHIIWNRSSGSLRLDEVAIALRERVVARDAGVHEQRALEQERRRHVLEQLAVRLEHLDRRVRRDRRQRLGRIHAAGDPVARIHVSHSWLPRSRITWSGIATNSCSAARSTPSKLNRPRSM